MNATEFIIKKFETNYPEIVKSIEEWTEFSIKKNWDEVRIILNQNNVNNCPKENEYGEINEKGELGNKQAAYLLKVSQRVSEYLGAKGFGYVQTWRPAHEEAPQGGWQGGILIKARYAKP
jgi:hypothetical protein